MRSNCGHDSHENSVARLDTARAIGDDEGDLVSRWKRFAGVVGCEHLETVLDPFVVWRFLFANRILQSVKPSNTPQRGFLFCGANETAWRHVADG